MKKIYFLLLSLSLFNSNVYASEAGQRCIQMVVENSQGSSSLLLNSCNIDDTDIPSIVNVLNTNSNYQELNLDSNPITLKGLNLLIDAKVSSLSLNNDDLGLAGARTIAKNPHIKTLWAENAALGDAGIVALTQNTTLTNLHIGNNNITAYGVKHLTGRLNLTLLDISNNPIGNKGLAMLAKMATLTTLIANNCQIANAGLIAFSHKEALDWLQLGNNSIGDSGAIALANQPGTKERFIYLVGNPISEKGIARLKANPLIKMLCVKPGDC